MDRAAEMMLWQAHPKTPPPDQSGVRNLNTLLRPLLGHAFGIDWDKVEALREEQGPLGGLPGIAEKVSPMPSYELYMASRQVREAMEDISFERSEKAFDAITAYGMVPHTVTGSSFCSGPYEYTEYYRPSQAGTGEERVFFQSAFGPLRPLECAPLSVDPEPAGSARREPRKFEYRVC
jgi:hypothetical protein